MKEGNNIGGLSRARIGVSVIYLGLYPAITTLPARVGTKIFTKRQLAEMIEVVFPHLVPVDLSNLGSALERTKEHWECVNQTLRRPIVSSSQSSSGHGGRNNVPCVNPGRCCATQGEPWWGA